MFLLVYLREKQFSTYQSHGVTIIWMHLMFHHLFSVKTNGSILKHLMLNSLAYPLISEDYSGINKGDF
jgi:hypothetical protein